MATKTLMVTTCGTSLLTNGTSKELRQAINLYANASDPSSIPPDIAQRLEEHVALRSDELRSVATDLEAVKRMSAELNSLITYYRDDPSSRQDMHWLVSTDTWLGRETAALIKQWLAERFPALVEYYSPSGLHTGDLLSFRGAMADLVKWAGKEIRPHRDQRYHVVFNLTGGFKSIQGFMQTLGMLYADESIYTFESSSDLLRLPSLPLRLDTGGLVRALIADFRRLANNLPVSEETIRSNLPGHDQRFPDTLVLCVEGACTLTPWGELVWQEEMRGLYAERLWPAPSERMRFGPHLEKTVERLGARRNAEINHRMDQLAIFLERGLNLQGIDPRPLKGDPKPPSTHEFSAWSDGQALRFFAHYEDGIFVVDQLAEALH